MSSDELAQRNFALSYIIGKLYGGMRAIYDFPHSSAMSMGEAIDALLKSVEPDLNKLFYAATPTPPEHS